MRQLKKEKTFLYGTSSLLKMLKKYGKKKTIIKNKQTNTLRK